MKASYKILKEYIYNNLSDCEVYFAIILLSKKAKEENIPQTVFKNDVKSIESKCKSSHLESSKLLDISDGIKAFDDISLQNYDENSLIELSMIKLI